LANLALVAAHENRHEDALSYLRKAASLDQSDPARLNNLAYRLALLGRDLDEAETWARRAIALDPDPNYRDTLGLVLIKQGRWDQAAKTLSDIVNEFPDALESLLHLGMAHAGKGRVESAREAFQTVIRRSQDEQLVRRANHELEKL